MSLREEKFGELPDGRAVSRFILENKNGLRVKLITYGGIISEIHAPGANAPSQNIVLGFDNLGSYLKGHPFFGATTGRVANRIGKGKFDLDGKSHQLATNNGPNHLHGGVKGFDKVLWEVKRIEAGTENAGVELSYISPDGEEGYPGNLDVAVAFRLTENDELQIDYTASTDQATPLNLTNHSYFNLNGTGDILDHEIQMHCRYYTPVDSGLIPTGEIFKVEGTPLDFLSPQKIGARIDQLKPNPGGYDHNYIIGKTGELKLAADVCSAKSGRRMRVFTTEPAIQLYSGNFLDGTLTGHGGGQYQKHSGLCLETQHYPDSVHHSHFPDTILRPGQVFKSRTIYKFLREICVS
jgi:aldose 1-epimerase